MAIVILCTPIAFHSGFASLVPAPPIAAVFAVCSPWTAGRSSHEVRISVGGPCRVCRCHPGPRRRQGPEERPGCAQGKEGLPYGDCDRLADRQAADLQDPG